MAQVFVTVNSLDLKSILTELSTDMGGENLRNVLPNIGRFIDDTNSLFAVEIEGGIKANLGPTEKTFRIEHRPEERLFDIFDWNVSSELESV
jgi:hypothetical protein